MPVLDPQALLENRVTAIQDFHDSVGTKKAEIDVSGGVDSAVILGLLATALGPENVIAVHSRINTNPEQTERAHEVAAVFGVKLIDIDLGPVYETLIAKANDAIERAYGPDVLDNDVATRLAADPTILGSIRSTLRAPVGRGFNRLMGGGIRHGTGNECEDRWLRFYQKGGDGEVDTNPVAMLSKGEVFQLALKLGVPRSIIAAPPSPDLWGTADDHNDEDEIGDYLGVKAAAIGQTFYSYIDVETGAYTHVGLIERVSRLADYAGIFEGYPNLDAPGVDLTQSPAYNKALVSPFAGFDRDMVHSLLKAARKVELATRHKVNPNIPSLGTRLDLVTGAYSDDGYGAGILTNTLPVLV